MNLHEHSKCHKCHKFLGINLLPTVLHVYTFSFICSLIFLFYESGSFSCFRFRILESDSRYHQVINNSPTKHGAAEPEKKEMTKKEKKEKKKDKAAAKKEKKENEKREKKEKKESEKKDKKMEDEKEKLPNSVTTPVEATPSITSADERSYSDSGSEVNSVASPANEEERILM